ncbi:MAG: TraR/DksA C4-type zinc finger protein [Bacteroidales bacterium]|nr:TraR/DksA C4-type zinc finger protein [Bacteroidales bacterium]
MSPEEKIELKTLIENKVERLSRQIVDLKELTQPIEPDCAIGRVSRMDAINNKSINESTLRKKVDQLNGLEYALSIFAQDDFEQCSVCGEAIPTGRLFIMPESRKCVRCASLNNS